MVDYQKAFDSFDAAGGRRVLERQLAELDRVAQASVLEGTDPIRGSWPTGRAAGLLRRSTTSAAPSRLTDRPSPRARWTMSRPAIRAAAPNEWHP